MTPASNQSRRNSEASRAKIPQSPILAQTVIASEAIRRLPIASHSPRRHCERSEVNQLLLNKST